MHDNLSDVPKDGKWILAYLYKNEYKAESIIGLDELDGLEYLDAKSSEYQLWHWPSGDIYTISPDREVEPKVYATPYSTGGTIWLPTLTKIGNDKDKIADALHRLES